MACIHSSVGDYHPAVFVNLIVKVSYGNRIGSPILNKSLLSLLVNCSCVDQSMDTSACLCASLLQIIPLAFTQVPRTVVMGII